MTEKELMQSHLIDYVNTITELDPRGGTGAYKCPLCNSGHQDGKGHQGAFFLYENGLKWKCHACLKGGDIFNLIEYHEGLTDFRDQMEFAEKFLDQNERQAKHDDISFSSQFNDKGNRLPKIGEYQDYLTKCHDEISNKGMLYYMARGINQTSIDRFMLGYDDEKDGATIPHDKELSYYVIRFKNSNRQKYDKPKGIEALLFNESALESKTPCFICEGQLDAVSIMQVSDYNAIALGNAQNRFKTLLEQLKKDKKTIAPFIISKDNDAPGEQIAQNIENILKELELPYVVANYSIESYPKNHKKDTNDFLRGDEVLLKQDIEYNVRELDKKLKERINEYVKSTAANMLQGLQKEIADNIGAEVSTGYPIFNSELSGRKEGGLFPSLYILGAISSLGKTSFCLQMADQIAEQGKDVLYFSLEMGAYELMSKSISRWTHNIFEEESLNNKDGRKVQIFDTDRKTQRQILNGNQYPYYSDREILLINEAMRRYRTQAKHLYIIEGVGNIGAETIRQRVEEHISITGNVPIVFVDYLQILQPSEIRATDKQNVDKSVLELKRLSRDYRMIVFAVSSLNRESYNGPLNMSAFKESGAVEYGSDVLIGLQPQGLAYNRGQMAEKDLQDFKSVDAYNKHVIDEFKASDIRDVELTILKNRSGKTGGKMGFRYIPMFNHFEEDESYVPMESRAY